MDKSSRLLTKSHRFTSPSSKKTGVYGEIHDDKTGALLAKYVVLKTNEYEVEAKIITTYGHGRRKARQ